MRTRFVFRLAGILLAALLLSACGGDDETPTPITAVPGQASVTALTVAAIEPNQVQAVVNGNTSNNCTAVSGIGSQLQGTTFLLDVRTLFTDSGACLEVPTPFSMPVNLDVTGLPAGEYTAIAGGVTTTFTLTGQQPPTNDLAPAASGLATNVNTAVPGATITVSGLGFPANSTVSISFGIQANTLTPVRDVVTDGNGAFSTQINLPQNALPGENWVFSAPLNGAPTTTGPILIVSPETTQPTNPETPQTNEPEVNAVTNGTVSMTNLYFIAIGDGGQTGPQIGCGDSILPVAITLNPPTVAPMTAAYNQLFTIKDQNYGGYYNALYQSTLTLDSITVVGRGFVQVYLSGNFVLGGECDSPRVLAQLEQVALQYDTVNGVRIYLNGNLLTEKIKPGGLG
jgi:hypothetical protein